MKIYIVRCVDGDLLDFKKGSVYTVSSNGIKSDKEYNYTAFLTQGGGSNPVEKWLEWNFALEGRVVFVHESEIIRRF
jgi:hypothetical protein